VLRTGPGEPLVIGHDPADVVAEGQGSSEMDGIEGPHAQGLEERGTVTLGDAPEGGLLVHVSLPR